MVKKRETQDAGAPAKKPIHIELQQKDKEIKRLSGQIKEATKKRDKAGRKDAAHKHKNKITPGKMKNKIKRMEMVRSMKKEKAKKKNLVRLKKKQIRLEKGEDACPRGITNTIETMRVYEETFIAEADEEIEADENIDEFNEYFKEKTTPKICMVTNRRPSRGVFQFLKELKTVIPNLHYYERKNFKLKDIIEFAKNREYTDVMIIYEKRGEPHTMILSHLPKGPTATFRISGIKLNHQIANHGNAVETMPELILNNFDTRLGHRIGRMLAALFPQRPNFKGRQVVTLHNQRDFIFCRHHRYEFVKNGQRANLQELGPRFTLKLKTLQHGTFDTKFGEFEFIYHAKMGENRKKLFV
ncbi:unnamed protein product [Moneuplotes crassus]|uniref:Brix domain-containing protein n=1 Tax=Euplotes crassus TaxID=5936 RepID=A0AAD2CYY8_EUPCR|nr:unnamed protein product [Moneuplotes crassus]